MNPLSGGPVLLSATICHNYTTLWWAKEEEEEGQEERTVQDDFIVSAIRESISGESTTIITLQCMFPKVKPSSDLLLSQPGWVGECCS